MWTEFIIKYWLTALFGLIATGLGVLAKKYHKLWKQAKDVEKQKTYESLMNDVKTYVNDVIKETEESHTKLYKAVLDVHQKQFQRDCYYYLKIPRDITLEEFESIYRNYEIYTSLGGNGIGTMLFEQVKEKYSTQLISQKIMDAASQRVVQTQPPIIIRDESPKIKKN